jgi:hypothetical protein
VIAIGLPAVDALIERLEDRRLTRSIGFWRSFAPHRTVLHVQDVAVQAIDKILDMDFYTAQTTSSYFSTEKPETRAKVIANIKAWWQENRGKPLVEMYRSRLEEGRAYQRIDRLRKIARLDPKAIDAVATLKRWSEGLTTSDKVEYAEELAAHADLSLLPEIRARALDRVRLPDSRAIWYLMQHGNAGDYRILRATLQDERRKGADRGNGNSPLGPIVSGARGSKNPLAVPLLVELLNDREGDYSQAYQCFLKLVELTGHNVSEVPPATRDERHAAIDRWLTWWKREGEEAFLSGHPAVREVTAEKKLELSEEMLGKLPPLVFVREASADVPVAFDVPRQSLAALAREGRIAASEDARGQPAFRFTSPAAALDWFDAAEPVAAGDASAAALAPAMRVQVRGLTRPDSRGRVWCSWDRALTPTAVFDGRRWQTYSDPLPRGRIDNPVGFISAFAGGNGEMLFQDRNHQFHLFDDAGHAQASSPEALLEQYADRVRAALPYPLPAATSSTATSSKTAAAASGGPIGSEVGALWKTGR